MTLIELIGFVITMAALILLFFKRKSEERLQRAYHEEDDEESQEIEEEDPLKEFWQSLNSGQDGIEKKKSAAPPPAPLASDFAKQTLKSKRPGYQFQTKLQQHSLTSTLDDYHNKTAIEGRKIVTPAEQKYGTSEAHGMAAYSLIKGKKSSYGLKVLNRLNSRRDMMICHEILSKPKGLSKEW